MDEPEWTPANEAERGLAAALARGDGAAFARLLESTVLLLPTLPEPGSPQETRLAEILPSDALYVPVFTSPESLVWAFGDLIGSYEEVDLGGLLQRWPDPANLLAVNPGAPIAVYLPPRSFSDLAEGRQELIPADAIRQVIAEDAQTALRRLCLQELSGRSEVDVALRPDPPASPLETALREAVVGSDGEAYLHALLNGGPVILLTGAPVAGPEAVFEDDFPWRTLGGDQARLITMFSSPAMLDRTGASDHTSVEVDFLHVLANWPGEEFVLCVNPGSRLELMLPGDVVLAVVDALAESLEPNPTQPNLT